MNFHELLATLEPVVPPAESGEGIQLFDSAQVLGRIQVIADKMGKSGFRSLQSSEFIGARLEKVVSVISDQLAGREEDLREERRRVGERDDQVARLLQALVELLDIGAAASAESRRSGTSGPDHLDRLYPGMARCSTRAGLQSTARIGEPFDAELHESVDTAAAAEVPSRHIAEVIRQGYRYGDRVVRVAKVVIAR